MPPQQSKRRWSQQRFSRVRQNDPVTMHDVILLLLARFWILCMCMLNVWHVDMVGMLVYDAPNPCAKYVCICVLHVWTFSVYGNVHCVLFLHVYVVTYTYICMMCMDTWIYIHFCVVCICMYVCMHILCIYVRACECVGMYVYTWCEYAWMYVLARNAM